ncbi:hypothetical protein BDN72DRAFT_848577 [Pluteus cervinus]|uniref:Uncharacterized protein n=1 Tax=Pluteus cervinus TaxID=181527 RepID=A0ACD3AAG4_9AGAR|nr:hypothetical protein BDN72DRAFT_848577 [Pluteus cervinus]
MSSQHKFGISANSEVLTAQRNELLQNFEDIESKAAQLEAQLAVLTAERAEVVEAALFYQAIFAPWKKVPNEILQRIFYWTKPTEPPTCIPFSRAVAPMQLAQVCSRWRAIAFATSSLWQDFKCAVYLPTSEYDQLETKEFIQNWLSRAGEIPLSITAIPADLGPSKTTPPSSPIPQSIFPAPYGVMQSPAPFAFRPQNQSFPEWLCTRDKFDFIKEIVIPNAPRTRDLYLALPSYYRHSVALLQQEANFLWLENLAFDCALPAQTTSPSLPDYPLLKHTPLLRKIKFVAPFSSLIIRNHTQLQLNWRHITHFETGSIPWRILLPILGHAKSLQYCKATLEGQPHQGLLFGGNAAQANQDPSPEINIPFLHTLDLTTSLGAPIQILENTQLPNLKVLTLTSEPWPDLARMLLKSVNSLSEFRLTFHGHMHEDTFKGIVSLPALSELTHLSIRKRAPNLIFGTISLDTLALIAQGHLMPHLHTFHFEGGVSSKLLINLLVTKGFISTDGSTIFPDLEGSKKVGRGGGVGAPFQQVKLYGVARDPNFESIQEQVGSERFTMEFLETDKWRLLNQIGWDAE